MCQEFTDYFLCNILQKSECDQLLEAAEKGDAATVERLINIRYIDVNTTEDVVSTLATYECTYKDNQL